MAKDRMKMVFKHLSSNAPPMHAFGIQNPVKAVGYSSYSSSKQPAKSPVFQFTNGLGKLTESQRIFYETNGFLVIPKLVPPECIERYRSRFQEIVENKIHIPGLTVMKDISYAKKQNTEKIIYKLQELYYDDVLFEYCKLPQILDYVESFCGPNIKAVHTMLINKPPDSGSQSTRHPLHQDLHYFPFRPANKIVCAWTAMENVIRANGCLVVIPGSHMGELLYHTYPEWSGGVNKMTHGITNIEDYPVDQRVYLEMEAGDTVLFHPLLIHGSGANRTEGFRKAISCHYAAAECYYVDVCGTNQESIANEMLDIARKKGADIDDIKYIWQYRARLVRGKESSL